MNIATRLNTIASTATAVQTPKATPPAATTPVAAQKLQNIEKSFQSWSQFKHADIISKPAGMLEIGIVKGVFQSRAQVADLERADKLVDEAMGLAYSLDPLNMVQAQLKMSEASKIRQTVASQLSPELRQRILDTDGLEKNALLRVTQGIWSNDMGTVSDALTDYKVGRERFQLVEDDILGRPHGGPAL